MIKRKDLEKLKEEAQSKKPETIDVNLHYRYSNYTGGVISIESSIDLDYRLYHQIRRIGLLLKEKLDSNVDIITTEAINAAYKKLESTYEKKRKIDYEYLKSKFMGIALYHFPLWSKRGKRIKKAIGDIENIKDIDLKTK